MAARMHTCTHMHFCAVWDYVEEVHVTRPSNILLACRCSFDAALLYVSIDFDATRSTTQSPHAIFYGDGRSELPSAPMRNIQGLDVVRDQQQDLQVACVLLFARIVCVYFVRQFVIGG
jgi:hypothetical protein